jgi:hypothetical protein
MLLLKCIYFVRTCVISKVKWRFRFGFWKNTEHCRWKLCLRMITFWFWACLLRLYSELDRIVCLTIRKGWRRECNGLTCNVCRRLVVTGNFTVRVTSGKTQDDEPLMQAAGCETPFVPGRRSKVTEVSPESQLLTVLHFTCYFSWAGSVANCCYRCTADLHVLTALNINATTWNMTPCSMIFISIAQVPSISAHRDVLRFRSPGKWSRVSDSEFCFQWKEKKNTSVLLWLSSANRTFDCYLNGSWPIRTEFALKIHAGLWSSIE